MRDVLSTAYETLKHFKVVAITNLSIDIRLNTKAKVLKS